MKMGRGRNEKKRTRVGKKGEEGKMKRWKALEKRGGKG